ncbi:hypothetical protein QR685DRAFT_601166 [Neurospora intermedia]|uniref:Uncharacterized protein n=1 Tax=Neurospora intermedia TaxID=5142 RepID=A0ABR3CYK0_NEUIN
MYGLQTSSGVYSTALRRIQVAGRDGRPNKMTTRRPDGLFALKELEDTERPFSKKQKQVPDECSHRHLAAHPPTPASSWRRHVLPPVDERQQSHLCLDLSQLSISPLTPCYTTHQSTSESHSFTRTGTHHQVQLTQAPPTNAILKGQPQSNDPSERHYSYECKASAAERPYIPRPSRTQQLFNPKLLPKLTSAVPPQDKKGVADEILAQREAERAKKKELERDDESPSRDVSPRRSRSLLAIPSHLHGEHMRKTFLSHRLRRLRPANAQSTPEVGILAGGQRARSSTHRGKDHCLLVVVRRHPAVTADVSVDAITGGQGHPGATILFPSPDPGHQSAHRPGETAEEKTTGQEDTTGTGKMAVDSRDTGVRRRNDLQSANRLPRHRRASGVSALSARD